jgi:hypothetical protein
MKKVKNPLHWKNITDAFITSDEWDNIKYNLTQELDALRDKKTFMACKDETFAHNYLEHAEDVIRKKGGWEISILSLIRELKEAIKEPETWRIFMQTLLLVTITNRAGEIPETADEGKRYKKDQSDKGGKRWINEVDKLTARNNKIIEHFREAHRKNKHLTPSRFADKHAAKYEKEHKIKPRTIRFILSKAVGN